MCSTGQEQLACLKALLAPMLNMKSDFVDD
jgi:hypothetical protein